MAPPLLLRLIEIMKEPPLWLILHLILDQPPGITRLFRDLVP